MRLRYTSVHVWMKPYRQNLAYVNLNACNRIDGGTNRQTCIVSKCMSACRVALFSCITTRGIDEQIGKKRARRKIWRDNGLTDAHYVHAAIHACMHTYRYMHLCEKQKVESWREHCVCIAGSRFAVRSCEALSCLVTLTIKPWRRGQEWGLRLLVALMMASTTVDAPLSKAPHSG